MDLHLSTKRRKNVVFLSNRNFLPSNNKKLCTAIENEGEVFFSYFIVCILEDSPFIHFLCTSILKHLNMWYTWSLSAAYCHRHRSPCIHFKKIKYNFLNCLVIYLTAIFTSFLSFSNILADCMPDLLLQISRIWLGLGSWLSY